MNKQTNQTPKTSAGDAFRHPAINGWSLFWILATPMTVLMILAMRRFDLTSPEGVSHMIQYSVRWAVPFIYFIVAASAVPILFPSAFTQWWLRNRRYVGFVFAVAMAWQGAFIFIMSNLHTGYYYEDVYALRDELEGSSGYLFLAAMVVTSFRPGRRLLSSTQWKLLHRSGVYFLWAYPFSVYWWNLYYYKSTASIDYIFYWAGFLVFAARIAAWGKTRWKLRDSEMGTSSPAWASKALGTNLIGAGIIASATGLYWQDTVSTALTKAPWSATLELWLPFWPFEPFLPLVALGIGTWLLTGSFATDSIDSRGSLTAR